MKKCPNCGRYYDNLQSFCLEDGTALISEMEAKTEVLPLVKQKKSKLPLVIFGFLVLLGGIVGVWLLFGDSDRQTQVFSNNSQNNNAVIIANSPSPTTLPTASSTVIPANDNSVNANAASNLSSVEQTNLSNSNSAANSDLANAVSNKEIVKSKPRGKPIRQQAEFFTFELLQCEMSGSLVTCDFNITNEAADRYFKLEPSSSLTIDNSGSQYGGYKVMTSELSNVGREGVLLVSKVPVKAKLMIQGINSNSKSLALLRLKFCSKCSFSSDEVQFREVPLFKID